MKLYDPETEVDFYFEWSTIVDGPVTYGMPLGLFKHYYKEEYGRNGMKGLTDRLELVEQHGVSIPWPSGDLAGDIMDEFFEHNQAGPDQTTATKEYILENYCKNWNA